MRIAQMKLHTSVQLRKIIKNKRAVSVRVCFFIQV